MLMAELEKLLDQPAFEVGDAVRLPDEIRSTIPQLATGVGDRSCYRNGGRSRGERPSMKRERRLTVALASSHIIERLPVRNTFVSPMPMR
jgi:hypothetical protein